MAVHVEDDQAPWMAIPKIQFTPVMARTGKVVHATTLATPNETLCGKRYRGWIIALQVLSCIDCKRLIYLPLKKPKAAR